MNACWFPAVCLYQEPFLCIFTSRTTDRRRRLEKRLTLEITVCYTRCTVTSQCVWCHSVTISFWDRYWIHFTGLSVLGCFFFCCSIISRVRVLVCNNHFLHISNVFKTYSCSAFEFSTCLYGCRFLTAENEIKKKHQTQMRWRRVICIFRITHLKKGIFPPWEKQSSRYKVSYFWGLVTAHNRNFFAMAPSVGRS